MSASHLHLAPEPLEPSAAPDTIRVLLADDHALMRRTLRLLLDEEQDIEVVAEADDLASVVQHVAEHRPRAIALDLGITNGSTSEAIRLLRERAPQTQIVIITMEENPVFAQRALDAGAIGFVSKDLADEELPEAIRRAAHDEQYVSPRISLPLESAIRVVAAGEALLSPAATKGLITRYLAQPAATPDGASRRLESLTPREREIMALAATGLSNDDIAAKLFITPLTVKTHVNRAMFKLGARDRAQLVVIAYETGIVRAGQAPPRQ